MVVSGVIIVFIAVLYYSFSSPKSLKTDSSNTLSEQNNPSNLPEYLMSEQEEAQVKEFALNFLKLYNTYSFSDYSNLLALGDYQTPEMQKKTLQIAEKLKQKTAVGFKQEITLEPNSFFYEYPEGSILNVKIRGTLKQYSNFYQNPELDFNKSYVPKLESTKTLNFRLELAKYGKNWLVNNLEILNN